MRVVAAFAAGVALTLAVLGHARAESAPAGDPGYWQGREPDYSWRVGPHGPWRPLVYLPGRGLFPENPPVLAPARGAEASVREEQTMPLGRCSVLGDEVLSEADVRLVLAATGWPEGRDLEEAVRVSYGESVVWHVRALGDCGRAHGLFQIHLDPWGEYCGMTAEQLLTAAANARCARLIFEYEQARGYPRWSNWTVKP